MKSKIKRKDNLQEWLVLKMIKGFKEDNCTVAEFYLDFFIVYINFIADIIQNTTIITTGKQVVCSAL
ncbi:hypothetical protein [uncultured Clostridium sp.]|uniref:hypothetical protein n=1 Tax=uncultured Clostridium sp. TaxID=59620 RepID=UPI0028E41CB0|nr:hypothetical protein [uncultured Clostridium sp.]